MTHTAADALHGIYTPATATSPARGALRALALTGAINAVTVVAGIIAMSFIPDQMNLAAPDKALTQIAAHHRAEVVAGWMFACCLAAFIPFIWLLVRSLNEATRLPATIGACIITAGATIDVAASLIFVTVGHALTPNMTDPAARTVGMAMLNFGASIDSLYNLLLGVGLVLIARSMRASVWPRWLGMVAVAAGVLSIPVSLQWYAPAVAVVQFASGTLLLVWVVGLSAIAFKRSR